MLRAGLLPQAWALTVLSPAQLSSLQLELRKLDQAASHLQQLMGSPAAQEH